jgi:DNA-binding transcriptional MerR regulator
MPDREIEKLYYSIGEVGELLDLEAHVLRYWESEFEALSPRKNRAGRRVYTDDDIEMVRRIKTLLREEKYTIAGARQVLARERNREKASRRLEDELREMRSFLQDLLDRL